LHKGLNRDKVKGTRKDMTKTVHTKKVYVHKASKTLVPCSLSPHFFLLPCTFPLNNIYNLKLTIMKRKTNIKTLLIFALVLLLSSNQNIAQNVGIGAESFIPDPSAVLELKSANQGFLPPRMSTAERDAIQNPATGLLIFNTTTNCVEVFIPPIWQSMYCGCTSPNPPTAGTHTPSATEIVWNWNSVAGADGYKYNTVNDFAIATDNGTSTTYTQEVLDCGTEYTLYVWAYNECGESSYVELSEITDNCPPCAGYEGNTFNYELVYGGQTYKLVGIGEQCWMAMNLNFTTVNSSCYGNNPANCTSYGRLYEWNAAMTACPTGWHLPSDAEWKQLEVYLGMPQAQADATGWRGTDEGGKLKSTTGWNSPNTDATDIFGFSAFPGGYRFENGTFHNIGEYGHWWSSTEVISYNAWNRIISYNYGEIFRGSNDKENGRSVRCLKD